MPSLSHADYLDQLRSACADHPDPEGLRDALHYLYTNAVAILTILDLEPARQHLQACYSPRPRGRKPRDPIVMLRILLLSLLVGEPSLNRWVARLRSCSILRALAGLASDDRGPGVGTLYDYLHRLHDGPLAFTPGADKPSDVTRRASRAEQPAPSKRRKKKAARKGKKGKKPTKAEEKKAETAEQARSAAAVVKALQAAPDDANPNDLTERLNRILLDVVVKPSAERDLLGDLGALVVGGDSSTLPTGAQGRGRRTCDHDKFTRCDCNRIYEDPDARSGWDSHRKHYIFGHRFYELSVTTGGHDLPLAVTIAAANRSDMTEGPIALDRLRRTLRDHTDGWKMGVATLDSGHDAKPIYAWLVEHDIQPVIPLRGTAPAIAPGRPDVKLSERGIPLCQAGCEMGAWGSAGKGRVNYICPLKTGLERCPLAPEGQPKWRCRPELTHGPTTVVRTDEDPRLFPSIHRNSKRFAKHRRARSGTERCNGLKKGPYKLVEARHRRQPFWLIRLHLMALLQHGQVWAAELDACAMVEQLLQDSGVNLAA